MEFNSRNIKIWGNAMREKFSEKVYLAVLFKTTSTQNQDSSNEFRESAHIQDGATPACAILNFKISILYPVPHPDVAPSCMSGQGAHADWRRV